MANYEKDSERQAFLRQQIENHPIWQYPPEERLQHTREWQNLYLLVLEFKKFLQKLQKRAERTAQGGNELSLLMDEQEMLDARFTRTAKLRGKLDTLVFTECMRKAVAKFDTGAGTEFMAYFDTMYVRAMHEQVNRQSMRELANIALTRREGRLWQSLCELCERQQVDPRTLSPAFYECAARYLDTDAESLRRLVKIATSVRSCFSLDQAPDEDDAPAPDLADTSQQDLQQRLEQAAEVMRAIALFAGKDADEYPRLFFTTDVLAPMCTPCPDLPPERCCALLEKQEALLWSRIFVHLYIDFLFQPASPRRLRDMLDLPLAHPLQDSSIAAYHGVRPSAVSYHRRRYTKTMQELLKQLQE